jgi:hypothetical protein
MSVVSYSITQTWSLIKPTLQQARKKKRNTIYQGLKFGQAAHEQQQQQGGVEEDEDEGDLGTHSTVLLHVVTLL